MSNKRKYISLWRLLLINYNFFFQVEKIPHENGFGLYFYVSLEGMFVLGLCFVGWLGWHRQK
ncbi:hypothetical protein V8C35DRAFT_307717 [Trichoderma chlorosporum]